MPRGQARELIFGKRKIPKPSSKKVNPSVKEVERYFLTKKDFFAFSKLRDRSPEADFGSMWVDTKTPQSRLNLTNSPRLKFRVSYIKFTGEVYAEREQPTHEPDVDSIEILGWVPNSNDEDSSYEVYYEFVEELLEDWTVQKDLSWVRERLRDFQTPLT